jgi:hypothetical protein
MPDGLPRPVLKEDDMKPLVFISHIHSDATVAAWLKEKTSDLLLDGIEFFVSSDRQSIAGGDRWLSKIEEALGRAAIVLVLCSRDSVLRPWINFEAGGAWMAGKRVIPVCYGELRPDALPEPLRTLQAYSIHDPKDLSDLVGLMAQAAGLRSPRFDPTVLSQGAPIQQSRQSETGEHARQADNVAADQATVVRLTIGSLERREWMDSRIRKAFVALDEAALKELHKVLDPELSNDEKLTIVNTLVAQSKKSEADERQFLKFLRAYKLCEYFRQWDSKGVYGEEHGDVLLDRVLELCQSPNAEIRESAVHALRSFGRAYGIPASGSRFDRLAKSLIQLVQDETLSVVRWTLPAIGDLAYSLPKGYHEAIRSVVESSIKASEPSIRAAGTWALGHMMPIYNDDALTLIRLILKQLQDRNSAVVDDAVIALDNLSWSADSAIGEVEDELTTAWSSWRKRLEVHGSNDLVGWWRRSAGHCRMSFKRCT